jgi:hypothetical protein
VNGDKVVRHTAVSAVLSVAGVAAWVSYWHAVGVVSGHGEPGLTGHLYPVVIDGLIVAASMVLLDSARHKEAAPRLAWWMLAAGIVATLAMNVLAGLAAGWLGAVVAAWPALAFVGCYELLMMLVRAAARRITQMILAPKFVQLSEFSSQVPADVEGAAEASMRATLAAGNPWSVNALATKFALPRKIAAEIRDRVVFEANGLLVSTDATGQNPVTGR